MRRRFIVKGPYSLKAKWGGLGRLVAIGERVKCASAKARIDEIFWLQSRRRLKCWGLSLGLIAMALPGGRVRGQVYCGPFPSLTCDSLP